MAAFDANLYILDMQLKDLKNQLDIKENKIRFINDVIEEKLLFKKKELYLIISFN